MLTIRDGVNFTCMLTIRDGVNFTCPFCGASAVASGEQGAVLHDMPACDQFNCLGPAEYLKAVNEELERRKNGTPGS